MKSVLGVQTNSHFSQKMYPKNALMFWSQNLCSLIRVIDEDSSHECGATFIEGTFRENQDDIFYTFGERGETVAQIARSSILGKVNDKAYVF